MTQESLSEIRQEQQRIIRLKTAEEKDIGGRAWNIYHGNDYHEYEHFFGLPADTLMTHIEFIRKQHESFALDLFSSTEALASLGIKGIAVGLTDPRPKQQLQSDRGKRWVVSTDLLFDRKKAWKKIQREMKKHKIPGFDLILERGLRGLAMISSDPALHFFHLQQMWSTLSENGMIVAEMSGPDMIALSDGNTIDFWNIQPGIKATIVGQSNDCLQLIKLPEAPKTLPINISPTISTLKSWKLETY